MLKYWLKVLLSPGCWIQNESYSSAWDKKLNELLDTEKFELTSRSVFSMKLGSYHIWTANHPYASFTIDIGGGNRVRPSRATIFKAYDCMVHDLVELKFKK